MVKQYETPANLLGQEGVKLGPTDWVEMKQDRVNMFADATDDHQWIHVDEEKAKKEMPDGKTIAHGYYMVSLLPILAAQNAVNKALGSSLMINTENAAKVADIGASMGYGAEVAGDNAAALIQMGVAQGDVAKMQMETNLQQCHEFNNRQ